MLATYYETGKFPDHRRPGEFCRPRPVLHDGFRTVILHALYITSTLFHWNLLTLLVSSIFWNVEVTSFTPTCVPSHIAFFASLNFVFVFVDFVLILLNFMSSRVARHCSCWPLSSPSSARSRKSSFNQPTLTISVTDIYISSLPIHPIFGKQQKQAKFLPVSSLASVQKSRNFHYHRTVCVCAPVDSFCKLRSRKKWSHTVLTCLWPFFMI